MKYIWEDLPKPLNCFTVRNAEMINLNTGEPVSYYSANTKIVVVQKCVTPKCTYYRTREAAHHYLNYAFKASAFGLPNEKAPSVPFASAHSFKGNNPSSKKPVSRTLKTGKKTQNNPKVAVPKDGEAKQRGGWLKKIFRGKHG